MPLCLLNSVQNVAVTGLVVPVPSVLSLVNSPGPYQDKDQSYSKLTLRREG
jgi:hypothetical protein